MNVRKATLLVVSCLTLSSHGRAQAPDLKAAANEIIKSDAAFAQAVADKDRVKFRAFIADTTTFNGGTRNELRGAEAVMEGWEDFFTPDGPSLTWAPVSGEVLGAGDVGYTTGRSVFSQKGPDGKLVERLGQYVTIWRKQPDGSWKVVFDTGSTLP